MTGQVLSPRDAVEAVAAVVGRTWAKRLLAETSASSQPITIGLHPGITTRRHVRDLGHDTWQDWADSWRAVEPTLPTGTALVRGSQVDTGAPHALVVSDLDAAVALARAYGVAVSVDVERARALAYALLDVVPDLDASRLRHALRLSPVDADVLVAAARWLTAHPDVADLSERQLAVPGMHTKWLASHGALVRDLIDRDVRREVRPRPAVTHLTYVDPDYAAGNRRRHDAWTAGDVHDLAYAPEIVVIVENRDCRLWFGALEGAVVAEGGGRAATVLLSEIPWVRAARRLVYWGDLDADGLEILDHLRQALASPSPAGPARHLESVLMDADTLHEYAHLGVRTDRHGRELRRSGRSVPSLTDDERAAYYEITTQGDVPVRRIEQERLPPNLARDLIGSDPRT